LKRAALARSVAVDQQTEQPLDPHSRGAQVDGDPGFSQRLGSASSELLLAGDPDRPLAAR